MTPQYIKINEYGDKYYYKDREMTIRHREDGPATEFASGYNSWYINGQLHRLDGPAVEWSDGSKYWFITGKELSEAKFLERTALEIVLTMDEIAAKLGVDVSKLKIKK